MHFNPSYRYPYLFAFAPAPASGFSRLEPPPARLPGSRPRLTVMADCPGPRSFPHPSRSPWFTTVGLLSMPSAKLDQTCISGFRYFPGGNLATSRHCEKGVADCICPQVFYCFDPQDTTESPRVVWECLKCQDWLLTTSQWKDIHTLHSSHKCGCRPPHGDTLGSADSAANSCNTTTS